MDMIDSVVLMSGSDVFCQISGGMKSGANLTATDNTIIHLAILEGLKEHTHYDFCADVYGDDANIFRKGSFDVQFLRDTKDYYKEFNLTLKDDFLT